MLHAITCMNNISPYDAWSGANDELDAKAYFYLARAYWVIGDLSEAQVSFKKSKASSEVVFNHRWTPWSCNNLALILTEQGKCVEACEYAKMAVSGMTAAFGVDHEETLIAKAYYYATKECQHTAESSCSLSEESTTKMGFMSDVRKESSPKSLFPKAPVLAGRVGNLETSPALNPLDPSKNHTDLEVWCDHGDDEEEIHLHVDLRILIDLFEGKVSGTNSSNLSTTQIHFYAAKYVFVDRLQSALVLYQRALPTAQKTLPPRQRRGAENTLQSNSR